MTDIQDRIQDFWNRDAATYDRSPSHAVSDPVEAAAWRAALSRALPEASAKVLDVGAGTGSISLLAAELGHEVTALDLSEAMLDQARRKAAERGVEISFHLGPADEPPSGPFDAVVERNMIWTSSDPVGMLRAWREVTPHGRLVMLEGSWSRDTFANRLRERAAGLVRIAMGIPEDHHDTYHPEMWEHLPLARLPSPGPLIDAIYKSGWRRVRMQRLRDVEWARRLAAPPVLRWLDQVPIWMLAADA